MPTAPFARHPVARPWQRPAAEVAEADLGVDVVDGLTGSVAAARFAVYGPNRLEADRRRPAWAVLAGQFTNAMSAVLAAAAVVTVLIGDVEDAVVIGAIVALNGAAGFIQEYRAERAVAALRRMAGDRATVRRDGISVEVPAADLVPGDVVLIAAGDIVPADLRLSEAHALRVAEAALTGESEPVAKGVDSLPDLDGSVVGDLVNMAFRGTAVTYGRAVGLVVATGQDTELGRIAALLHSHSETPTPLERRLQGLARRMAVSAVAICAVALGIGVARGEAVHIMFLTAVSLAVAAIPEGLPAVITVALALGAQRMARRSALIRKLTAVETLGSVNVICTDKTGTLTQNRMAAEKVWTQAGEFHIEGHGYDPSGVIGPVPTGPDQEEHLNRVATVAAACNDATLRAPSMPGGGWQLSGDPTEGALLALAGRLGTDPAITRNALPRTAELAFDAQRRRMTTVHRAADSVLVATKGATETVLPLIRASEQAVCIRAASTAERWAAEGYRVLALADRHLSQIPEHPEEELHFVGLVALADPPRPESAGAIAACRDAGIQTVMITGDHPATAAAIAARIGIPIEDGTVMAGEELERLTDMQLSDRVAGTRVFARVNPEQKLRVVDAWHAIGGTVAMTGDGVNDAPALRQADIGVAMGQTGTDVSKEAADMVLADDNFATIVHAVEEGRRIYDNIRRTVRYLLTTNSGEVWVMFLAPILALPLPLVPVQILWINLVTDSLPAIALGLQRAEPDIMRRRPRPANESLFAYGLWQHALYIGLLMAAVVIPLQAAARAAGWHWQTMVFTTLAFLQLGHALAVRSELHSALRPRDASNRWLMSAVAGTVAVQVALIYIPALHGIFHTASLGPAELATVAAASTIVFLAVETEKWVRRRRWGPS